MELGRQKLGGRFQSSKEIAPLTSLSRLCDQDHATRAPLSGIFVA